MAEFDKIFESTQFTIEHNQIQTKDNLIEEGVQYNYCEWPRGKNRQYALVEVVSVNETPDEWKIKIKVVKGEDLNLRPGFSWSVKLSKHNTKAIPESYQVLFFNEGAIGPY